jgi:hypothetical protein
MIDKRRENVYIVNSIEIYSDGVNIALDSIWISNLSSEKKIEIRRIASDIDHGAGYPFGLMVNYYVQQDSRNNITAISSNINLAMQKMSNYRWSE